MYRKSLLRIASFTLALLFFTGCSSSNPTQNPAANNSPSFATEITSLTTAPVAAASTPASLSEETLKNMGYMLGIVKEAIPGSDGVAQLTDGKFEYNYPNSASGVRVLYQQNTTGDLNGDRIPDAAVILAVDTGGSGTFQTLVVVLNQKGQPEQAASSLLGDRVKIENFQIQNGQIIINMLVQGPSDPMCCPSQPKQAIFKLQNGQLIEQNP